MSELRINNITDTAGSSGPIIAGVSTVTSTSHMVMPSGPTEMRGGRGRGVFGGGETPTQVNTIDKIEIATTGNAIDFGDLGFTLDQSAGASSATRGLVAGGRSPESSTINFITLSSEGGGNDFGDLTQVWNSGKGASNGTTAIWFGGEWSGAYQGLSRIEFNIIATTGNASQFGNLEDGKIYTQTGSFESPTRGFIGAGSDGYSPYYQNTVDFVTIATKGDSKLFGDLSQMRSQADGCSSSTRGCFLGGHMDPSFRNVIDFVTMSTLGNFTDFGDMTTNNRYSAGTSNSTRGVIAIGQGSDFSDAIHFITIATTGNSQDFGDLTVARRFSAPMSDSHGGLGD